MRTTLRLGDITDELLIKLVQKEDGIFQVLVRSWSSDRAKTIKVGPARLITNVPGAVSLGETTTENGGDRRLDERWETSYRTVRIGELPSGGFVAYATKRSTSGSQFSGGDYVVALGGEAPFLDYGTAFARWASELEGEAYAFLSAKAERCTNKVQRSLRFGAGVAHSLAPHDQRRRAWVSALRGLGVGEHGDVRRIVRSVRTATVKAALRLGWKPSVAPPKYWEGLPTGVVEVPLEE
jgi:hypothetical protein